jgi:hypothetical protein
MLIIVIDTWPVTATAGTAAAAPIAVAVVMVTACLHTSVGEMYSRGEGAVQCLPCITRDLSANTHTYTNMESRKVPSKRHIWESDDQCGDIIDWKGKGYQEER